MKNSLALIGVIVYLSFLLFLGIQRFLPNWNSPFPRRDLGTWAMYRDLVEHEEYAYLLGPNNARIDFNPMRFIWHHGFVSSAVPQVNSAVIEAFVSFLARQEEVVNLIPAAQKDRPWMVVFNLKIRRNRGDWEMRSFKSNVELEPSYVG